MTTEQILMLDLRKEGNEEKLQKILKKIKPLNCDCNKVPLERIEKLLSKICRKYVLYVQYMTVNRFNEYDYYTISVKRDDTHEWVNTVYGCSVYEVHAKLAILLYSVIKNGKVPERQ